jgi:hypothetical protein
MMCSIQQTAKFKKDLKRVKMRGYDLSLLKEIIELLQKKNIFQNVFLTMSSMVILSVIVNVMFSRIGCSSTGILRTNLFSF